MKPPQTLDVLDRHGGFTIETTNGDTLWRPGCALKERDSLATLRDYDEHSFYQCNDDVTRARYRVRTYRYPVLAWFDNATGERIA